jgi:hypothetical protein
MQQESTAEDVSQGPQTDLVVLGRKLATLNCDLATAEKRTDGRNAIIRSLKKQIADATEQALSLDQINILTKVDPNLGLHN